MTNKTLLSPQKLTELGNELYEVIKTLEMNTLALDSIDSTKKLEETPYPWLIDRYIELAYTQTQHLIDKLNKVALVLMVNDDPRELEGSEG